MRELKFRAFDGQAMRYDVTGFENGAANEMRGVFLDGDYYAIAESAEPKHGDMHPRAAVMQSIGLHDCAGNPIYEGDILREGDSLYIVEWDSQYAKFHLKWTTAYQYPGWNRGIEMEIVGNIHQNPEIIPTYSIDYTTKPSAN